VHFVFGDPGHLPHLPERAFDVTDACRLVRVHRHIEHPCDQSSQLGEGPETTVGPLGKVDGFLRNKRPFNKTVKLLRKFGRPPSSAVASAITCGTSSQPRPVMRLPTTVVQLS
jgi:hypothetical protein